MPVAVPNYRLTTPATPIQHPIHAEDVLSFLNFILTWEGPFSNEKAIYDRRKLYLIGHSCSAHMLSCIYLSPANPNIAPSLVPSLELLASTRGLIFSEGIYDIDLLLRSFPGYKEWFIANTFGDCGSYTDFNVAAYDLRTGGENIRWLILHSKDDSLVDQTQAETMYEYLLRSGCAGVEKDWESIKGEHNDILVSDAYCKVVVLFVGSDIL